MAETWQYQIRVVLAPEAAEAARRDPAAPELAELQAVLARHDAALKCQYDAFADYVAEAERQGVEKFPLHAWTKATIEDPAKKAKYLQAFTLYVGGQEVYDRAPAEALEAELQPLVGGGQILRLTKHDTNPANNPQMPERYRPNRQNG